ncbi:N-acetylmuramoyl-L-alanine amidase [Cellulophaga phage phi4:1]|uniref:N-acetylmuramoyl-L-alanine amidase n=5 Tax=Lightbulbvirus TaxID=1918522 RepID=A0A0S2MWH1_9CAUD|nr:endolysin [Cellulophaga phage phi4:1]YP_008241555.1 endolysin [Cellulophaga phage phi17:2]ALO80067.1 N-acetylmuramoyl-L-alanine amidase [Cellulophaga phage phi4:1_13]ALO80264.1 N-acetylmuramoyl-L-alanine amidase [Cellulophaga phage phi4:1_18]ALO80463.1 N-acetylmuramoyl-L-alanine amidase [Cellulophaga phage phi17:2_18]AGO47593.1 N-acetylmuramoyl-L-alanine amidase [Cellulophaga phage phi17:2]AGO49471.1 N-acetylmuramoyl-L-alanine amidase [Cellulophaga phage phi4:1]
MGKITVVIDPGHGGIDSQGNYTTAPNKMFTFEDGTKAYEGKYNRLIASGIGNCLKSHDNIDVVYTVSPEDARDLSLSYRVKVANQYDPKTTLFVSVHNNAGGGTGYEIYTTRGTTKSDELAEEISNAIEHVYKSKSLNLRYDFSDGDKDKEVDFYVISKTKCPAVLLECLFFDSKKDIQYLNDPYFIGSLSSFIYTGILNYINKNFDEI